MVTRVGVSTGAPASIAAFSPTFPAGYAAGDRAVLFVIGKYGGVNNPTINQSWGLATSYSGGTGATGNDVGTMFCMVYIKELTSGSETAPTVTPTGTVPNSWEWIMAVHRPGSGKLWRDSYALIDAYQTITGNGDTSTASPLTVASTAIAAGFEPTAGDAIFCIGGIPTDLGTALGATSVTVPGLSGGTLSTATSQYIENSLGNDTAAVWAGWTGFTGTATAGTTITPSYVITGASNHSGITVNQMFRETDPPRPRNIKTSNPAHPRSFQR